MRAPILFCLIVATATPPPRSSCRDLAILGTKSRPDLNRSGVRRQHSGGGNAKIVIDVWSSDDRFLESLILDSDFTSGDVFARPICMHAGCKNQLAYVRRSGRGARTFMSATGNLDSFTLGRDKLTAVFSEVKLLEYDLDRHAFVPNGTCFYVDEMKLSVPAAR